MRSMERISSLRLLLVAPASFLLLVVAGCLLVPIPDKGPHPFPDATLQFLEAGGATRDDVLDQLGEPDWRFDDYRVFVYDGSRELGKLFWGYFGLGGFSADGDAGTLPMRDRMTLCIAFDTQDFVVAHSVQGQPAFYIDGYSIRDRVKEWAKEEHLEHIDLQFEVPADRSGIVFYRPGGIFDSGAFDVWILIGEVPIAQMQEGTYLPIVAEPADHDVRIVPISFHRNPDHHSPPLETSIETSSGATVYLRVRVGMSGAKLEKRPESEAGQKLHELGLISPPPAYAGW